MNKIDEIREKRKLSYGVIAQKTGLSTTYIHLLAKGKRSNPSLDVMQRIADALKEKVVNVFSIGGKGADHGSNQD